MNEYSNKWWFWGLAGAVLWPVILLAVDGHLVGHSMPMGISRVAVSALFVAFAGGLGIVAVPVLPVWPWLRCILLFLYIPAFICAVRFFAPWAPLS